LILDSGASKHVTGSSKEFESYTQYPLRHIETIQTADGTSQPIKGLRTVQCTPAIKLSSILHVPAFPVNLVSLSALVDQIDCRIILDKKICLIQERMTGRKLGRKLGTGTRHKGLWYMDRDMPNTTTSVVLAAILGEKEAMAMIDHCRMGHMAFDKMYKVFPDVMCGVDKSKLKCDACEYAKHTRTSYVSKGLKSTTPFMLIHSDVWTCPVISISGMKYFVTFVDCHTRMTWIYLLRHKDEVFKCFQDFYAFVKNQFGVQVRMIRTDNGTEYVNKLFSGFLSAQGMQHKTSCPDTPPQNGVAERKNRHILEVARSLMYTMNVPKKLWSEAVMTATYLINRMPSRVIGIKSPCEMLMGENKFLVPQSYLDVLVLLEIIDRQLENWIQEQLNASSLVTLQDKEVTNVGVPLNGEHLLAWTLLFERLSLSMERKPISVHYLKILTLQNP
jgi:transposase InsO family protein